MNQLPRRAAAYAIALLFGATQTTLAYFPTGDVFELRPSRVRIATLDETADLVSRWQNFRLDEPIPSSPRQVSLRLSETVPLVAVIPARNWGNSDRSIYSVGSVTITGSDVSLDYYIFDHPSSGATDSFSPPSEQIVPLGVLPTGDYNFNVRRWFLNYEDRLGFEPSQVAYWSPPIAPGIFPGPPDRYVTDDEFAFSVNIVPEPASYVLWVFIVCCFNLRKQLHRQITK